MTMFMTSEDEAEELREEGNALFAKGEYTSACAKYEEAIDSIDSGMMATAKADGVKVKCLLNLAAAHMKLEAWEPVVEACNQALKLDERSLKGFLRRARAHFSLGNTVAAESDVRAALALDPNSSDALTLKLRLDKGTLAREQAGLYMQKRAFGSFWGGTKVHKEEEQGVQEAGQLAQKGARALYQDRLSAEAAPRRVLCWFELGIEGKVLPQRVMLALHPQWAPKTVENFRCLCTGEKHGDDGVALAYAGSAIHRVCKGFVLQGGDIVHKKSEQTGEGIASIYGGGFANELPLSSGPRPKHIEAGMVAMANNGRPKSNGCQFYITMDAAPWLDHDFVIFGQVVEGMRTLREIEALEVHDDDRPLRAVEILAAGQLSESQVDDFMAAQDAKRKAFSSTTSKKKPFSSTSSNRSETTSKRSEATSWSGSSPAGTSPHAAVVGEQRIADVAAWPDDPGPLYDLDHAVVHCKI